MASVETRGETAPAAPTPAAKPFGQTARFNALLFLLALVIVAVAGTVAEGQAPVGDQFAPRPTGIANWDWWRAPIEINAFGRQVGPRIDADLNSVHFHVDGQRGWGGGRGAL